MKNSAILKGFFAALIVMSVLVGVGQSSALSQTAQIVVTLINQEPDPVAPGNTVDVRFRIENQGSDPAQNLQIRLVPKYPFSFYGAENETKNIGTLEGSQINAVGVREKWTLLIDSNAATGSNPIEFWYRSGTGIWVKAGEYTITIKSREAVLAINSITSDPKNIVPGTKTKVSFLLENLADNDMRDIKLKIDTFTPYVTAAGVTFRELPFTPIDSGNEKTIMKLARGESKQVEFELFTDANAESKIYKVPYTLTYSDNSGTNFSNSGIVGLLVDSDPELSIYLEKSDAYTAGATGTITVKFVNKGFSNIKFLDVKMMPSKDFNLISNSEVYIGKLDSDDYETADFTLILKDSAKEKIIIPLSIEYRDANGHFFTKTYSLEQPVYSASELKARNGNGGNSLLYFIIVVVIIVIGIFVYRKMRVKSKKKA